VVYSGVVRCEAGLLRLKGMEAVNANYEVILKLGSRP